MSNFFIKKLGHQELGYKNKNSNIPGESRGQYFLVSKKHLDFFPQLEQRIPQDLQILNIVSHFSTSPTQAKYIYNNDKFHGSKANSPRNEHRININLNINPEREVYHKDDILIFKKEMFLNEDEDEETAYLITRYREKDEPKDYAKLLNIINTNKKGFSSRNYAVVNDDKLIEINKYRKRLFSRVMSTEPILPEVDFTLLTSKELYDQSTFKKSQKELDVFEKQIKRIVFDKYNYRCVVSDIGFKWQELTGVKNSWRGITGAHIKPRAHKGEYSAKNIIPLIEPLHQLFDRGVFTITNKLTIEVHKQALNDPLLSNFHKFHNKKLDIPDGIELSLESIEHHWKIVFGMFKTGGVIRSLNN